MPDVREWWPDISNREIEELRSYDGYELRIICRLVGTIGGGKEISEDDLCQGVPSDKLGHAREAIDSLVKKGLLRTKPKPGITIYQVDPKSYTETLKKFSERIRVSSDLKEALLFENLRLLKMSDALVQIFNNSRASKGGNASIRPSDKVATFNDEEELGIILTISFGCPNSHYTKTIEFEILDPRDMSTKMEFWNCLCGYTHTCYPFGTIR